MSNLNEQFDFRGLCELNMNQLKTRHLFISSALLISILSIKYSIFQLRVMLGKQVLIGFTYLNLRERLHVIPDTCRCPSV